MAPVAELSFTVPVRITNAVPPFEGLVVHAVEDPMEATYTYVRYELDGEVCYGLLSRDIAMTYRSRPWGTGILYEVPPELPGVLPGARRNRGIELQGLAEVEFTTWIEE